jgi:hypothetical protein
VEVEEAERLPGRSPAAGGRVEADGEVRNLTPISGGGIEHGDPFHPSPSSREEA